MKAAGIVVEYNPFHKGHQYHLQKVKELTNSDVVVAVMSGNIVQRGEFAIIDKWKRAKAAIENGVDLVIELPSVFACQSATQFGSNAVDILALAKVSSIVFGSETNNLEELKEIADLSFNIDNFKTQMKKGYSYPYVYGYMADSYGPNDILAISYLRQLKKHPSIEPISILRTSDYNNDQLDSAYPSALAIRTALKNNQDLKDSTLMKEQLLSCQIVNLKDYYGYIRNILLSKDKKDLANIFLMDEGIENLLVKSAYKCFDYDQFIEESISKRYTRSRIQRTLMHLMLNNTKEDIKNLPAYDTIRPLAFNNKGKQYLSYLAENDVKIANHFTANIKQYRDIEYKVAVLYSMNMNAQDRQYICRSEIAGLNL